MTSNYTVPAACAPWAEQLPAWLSPRAPQPGELRVVSITTIALDRRRTNTAGLAARVRATLRAAALLDQSMSMADIRGALGFAGSPKAAHVSAHIASVLTGMQARGEVRMIGSARPRSYLHTGAEAPR